jgi:hypothetical protein
MAFGRWLPRNGIRGLEEDFPGVKGLHFDVRPF